MSTEELAKKIAELIRPELRSIIAPILPIGLATLDGWSWKNEQILTRTLLTRGAPPIDIIPPIQNEKGWINHIGIVFNDPRSLLHFAHDNWNFTLSPYQVATISTFMPTNSTMWCNVYNPATPEGPLYGLVWSPSQFWPYRTGGSAKMSHPATAPTATSQLVAFVFGRQYIRDEKQFYESIFLDSQRQTLGKITVPIRRAP